MNKKFSKVFGKVLHVITVILLIWIFLSWINVISNNLNPNPTYWDWNFFVMFLGIL